MCNIFASNHILSFYCIVLQRINSSSSFFVRTQILEQNHPLISPLAVRTCLHRVINFFQCMEKTSAPISEVLLIKMNSANVLGIIHKFWCISKELLAVMALNHVITFIIHHTSIGPETRIQITHSPHSWSWLLRLHARATSAYCTAPTNTRICLPNAMFIFFLTI